MVGLFIGAAHLFLMLNAGIRSVAGKWWLGGVVATARIVLLMALAMAGTRIRASGAEATSSLTIALYAGPALTLLTCALSFHRKRRADPGSEDARVASVVMRAWLAVGVMDVIYLLVNVLRITRAQG
jgi:hypothetical protein